MRSTPSAPRARQTPIRTLEREAGMLGYEVTLIQEGPHYDYLARLSRPAYEN